MRIALLALWIMALAAPMPVMSQGRQGGNRQNHTERPARQPQHRPGGDRRPQQPRPPQSNKPRPSRPSQPQRLGDIILRHRHTSSLAAVLRHLITGDDRRHHRHTTTVCRALCLHALWHHRQGTAHLQVHQPYVRYSA